MLFIHSYIISLSAILACTVSYERKMKKTQKQQDEWTSLYLGGSFLFILIFFKALGSFWFTGIAPSTFNLNWIMHCVMIIWLLCMMITCCHGYRMQDAVRLVHLFNVVHPQSESAQQAQRQQAAGLDLLKVNTQYIVISVFLCISISHLLLWPHIYSSIIIILVWNYGFLLPFLTIN